MKPEPISIDAMVFGLRPRAAGAHACEVCAADVPCYCCEWCGSPAHELPDCPTRGPAATRQPRRCRRARSLSGVNVIVNAKHAKRFHKRAARRARRRMERRDPENAPTSLRGIVLGCAS